MMKDNPTSTKVDGIVAIIGGFLIIAGALWQNDIRGIALLIIGAIIAMIAGVTMIIARTGLRKTQKLDVACLLLCMMIISPPISGAAINNIITNMNSTKVIDVQVTDSLESIKVLNETLPVQKHVVVETLGNGSRYVTISVNISKECYGVCITMETMIPSISEIERRRTVENKASIYKSSYNVQSVYPWKYWWDGMLFLEKGNNGTHLVSYDRDDNFDTYPDPEHAGQFYLSWILRGIEKDHQYIGADIAAEWLSGAISRENVISYMLTIGGGTAAVIGGILAIFKNPYAGFLTIVAGISAIFGVILQILGYTESDWLQNVAIDQGTGGISTWAWGWKTSDVDGLILEPLLFDIYTRNDLVVLLRHRRVGLLLSNTIEFFQSWGADRDDPGKYTITAWAINYVNPGFFGITDLDYGY